MYTSPSLDDLLLGLQVAIENELKPFLSTPTAQATAAMMQSVIQEIRQALPVYDTYLVDEHNAMVRVLRDVAEALGDAAGPEADRIRARAAELGSRADLPAPPDRAAIAAAHREMADALEAELWDLDVLQRAGDTRADRALDVLRAHVGPRLIRDVETLTISGGLLGRG
jgi:hypothetical protein